MHAQCQVLLVLDNIFDKRANMLIVP